MAAVAGAAALDVHMIRRALIIGIIDAFDSLAVDADSPRGMAGGIFKGIPSFPSGEKALAAGPVTFTGMPPAYHDISLAAEMLLIVGTIFNRTFQIRHTAPHFCAALSRLTGFAAGGAQTQNLCRPKSEGPLLVWRIFNAFIPIGRNYYESLRLS